MKPLRAPAYIWPTGCPVVGHVHFDLNWYLQHEQDPVDCVHAYNDKKQMSIAILMAFLSKLYMVILEEKVY